MTHEIKNLDLKEGNLLCSCGQYHPATVQNYTKDGKSLLVVRMDTTKTICLSCGKNWSSEMCWRNGCSYHSY